MLAEGAVEAFVLLEAVLQAGQVGREHVRATRTLRQKLTNHFIDTLCFVICDIDLFLCESSDNNERDFKKLLL